MHVLSLCVTLAKLFVNQNALQERFVAEKTWARDGKTRKQLRESTRGADANDEEKGF